MLRYLACVLAGIAVAVSALAGVCWRVDGKMRRPDVQPA